MNKSDYSCNGLNNNKNEIWKTIIIFSGQDIKDTFLQDISNE